MKFTAEEVILFAYLTLQQQLKSGLIDEEHLPPNMLSEKGQADADALEIRAKAAGIIPHPVDIHRATQSLYDDVQDYYDMINTTIERSKEQGLIPDSAQSIH